MRWLVLTDDYPPLDGGVATWTAAVAAGLHAAGDEVTVLARKRPGLGEGMPWRVIGVRGPRFGRHGGLWAGAAAWWRVRDVDRVLATTWGMATHMLGWCSARGIPLHVTFHGSDLTRPPFDPAAFDAVCAAARCWTVSRYLAEVLATRGFDAKVLPAPIDAAMAASNPTGRGPVPTRWAYVGRATPLKGGDRFVRLVAAAGAEGTVFGDGPELPAWRLEAARLGARVRFAGRVPRDRLLAELADHALTLLLPRAAEDGQGAEGFGLALVEAAAVGVAGVGCRTGGTPEAVGPGLVLDDPDDVAGSVAAIRAWWTPHRGAAARAWVVEHHGVARVIEALRR